MKLNESCVQRECSHAVNAISAQKHEFVNGTWLKNFRKLVTEVEISLSLIHSAESILIDYFQL